MTVSFDVDIRLSAEAARAIPAFAEWMTDLPGKVQVMDDLSIHTEQDGPDWVWDWDWFFEARLLQLQRIFPYANSFKLHLAGGRQRTAGRASRALTMGVSAQDAGADARLCINICTVLCSGLPAECPSGVQGVFI